MYTLHRTQISKKNPYEVAKKKQDCKLLVYLKIKNLKFSVWPI